MGAPKSKSNLNSTRAERRKKFSKAIDMDVYRKCCGTPIYMDSNKIAEWPDLKCTRCNGVTGEMFKKDGKWYCYWCEDRIESPLEEKYDGNKPSEQTECKKE